jgi:hypothetical protein
LDLVVGSQNLDCIWLNLEDESSTLVAVKEDQVTGIVYLLKRSWTKTSFATYLSHEEELRKRMLAVWIMLLIPPQILGEHFQLSLGVVHKYGGMSGIWM